MARKVFISVLGTGFYSECVYKIGEFRSDTTRFIQQATLQMLTQQKVGGEWTKNDQIYIVLTEKAKEYNWDIPSGKRYNPKDKKDEPYIGLKSALEQMSLPTPIKTIDIPDGNNEDEIWTIFDRIYKKLDREDRLYLDLTHAFRYIPMLLLVLVNYSKFLNRTNVEQITYGNWENRDCSKKPEVAQIIDITPLAALQDWTNAAADYLEHGDATKLQECARRGLTPLFSQGVEQIQTAREIDRFCKKLHSFCELLIFNRSFDIIAANECLALRQTSVQSSDKCISLTPLQPLFESIRKSTNGFYADNPYNMIFAAKLCLERNNFQSAITFLQEGLVTILCSRHNLNPSIKKERDLVGRAFEKCHRNNNQKAEPYAPTDDISESIIDSITTDPIMTSENVRLFIDVQQPRNDYNHAGMNDKPTGVAKLKKLIRESVETALSTGTNAISFHPSLLINLSNHPHENWSAEQKEAAKEYGEVRDMPFPAIDPEEDIEQIRERADEYISKIIKLNAKYAITVHLMGEMSFVVYAVSRLSERGIRCICSTSERDTEDLGGGEKKVTFRFKRFRDYDC